VAVSPIDQAIVRSVAFAFRPMTLNGIAESTGISWVTVRNHVQMLVKRGVLKTKKQGGRVYYVLSDRMY
tara:strand:+ start:1620 stop:1826 length:207 start_codon:yes stop_codon:yes gene_type:complete